MNERVAEALHKGIYTKIEGGWIDHVSMGLTLANYTKKVLDHLVMLEEEVQDLHRRNHQLSRKLRALQGRVDRGQRRQT